MRGNKLFHRTLCLPFHLAVDVNGSRYVILPIRPGLTIEDIIGGIIHNEVLYFSSSGDHVPCAGYVYGSGLVRVFLAGIDAARVVNSQQDDGGPGSVS